MNFIVHIAGMMGLIWLVRLMVVEYEQPFLGYAIAVVSLWLLLRMFMAAIHDWRSPYQND